jgi:hypothetical protein
MRRTRGLGAWMAVLTLFLMTGAAWAQGYTVTTVSGQWHAPPASKTALNLSAHQTTNITLPFNFMYFGSAYSAVHVGDEGFIQIGPTNANQSAPATSFPNSYDGTIAVAWYYHMHATGGSQVNTHVTGTAPSRVFHVTWEAVGTPGIYAQIQLFEATGRIVLAYSSGGSWSSANPYYLGIQAPGTGDNRYVLADGINAGRSTAPSSDFQFDPVTTNFSGRLLMSKPVVDATGIGNTTLLNQPVAGAKLEIVNNTGGAVVGKGITNADGTFTVAGLSLNPAQSGTLRVTSEGQAAVVRTSSTANPTTLNLSTNVSFATSTSVGTITLDNSTDPGATMRESLNILTAIQKVYDFAAARSTDAIPRLDVYYDPSSTQATAWTPATTGGGAATLRIGSSAAANPDQWDDDVIGRVYALHVFQSITGVAPAPTSLAYDQQAGAIDALALGFGWYARAAIKGSSVLFDGTSASAATSVDIESSQPTTAKGPGVPGWVAMGLYDLIDDDNETHDWSDGTARSPGTPLSALDTLTTATAGTQALFEAFVAQGGDGPGAARVFIHHGLLPDDAYEANDTSSEAKSVGSTPLIQRNLVLNIANEDWFRLTVPTAVTGLNIDVVFDPLVYDTQVAMDVRNAATGQVIGVGTPAKVGDPVRYVGGALPAGTYVVRVAHTGGSLLPAYTLQAYEALEITRPTLSDWTVGIPYAESLGVRGGIPGYKLGVPNATTLPAGLVPNDTFARLGGVPTRAGTYGFLIQVADSADPPNNLVRNYTIVINEHLQVGAQGFTPLVVGRTDGFDFGRTGGTDPISVTTTTETPLLAGLAMSMTAVRLDGVPTEPGSSRVHFEALDFAGDSISRTTTVVVCPTYVGKNSPASLAEGASTCGWPVDAVKGAEITASVKAGKKQPKRVLDFVVVDARGAELAGGVKTTGKSGKSGVKKLVVPESGRYFVLCSSGDGPACELVATITVAPPKKQAGVFEDFGGAAVVDVPFGALPGATFSLKAKPSKGSDAAGATVQWLISPDGRYIPPSQLTVTEKDALLTVAGACDIGGTWIVRLRSKPGSQGDYGFSMKITQPKGAAYTVD